MRRWLSGSVLAAFTLGSVACTQASATPSKPSTPTIVSSSAIALGEVKAAASRTLSLTASVSVEIATFSSGRGQFDFSKGTGSEQLAESGGTETVYFQPTIVFDHQAPMEYARLPAGKTWIAAEPSDRGKARFSFFILQVEDLNPTFFLAQVNLAAVQAWVVGKQTVRNTETTEFLVKVSLHKAPASWSGPYAKTMMTAFKDEQTYAGISGRVSALDQQVEVWVDGAGRVVQLQYAPPGSWGKTTATVTAFGAEVDPKTPPRSQTVNLATLSGRDLDHDSD